jgi:hypothetical protein
MPAKIAGGTRNGYRTLCNRFFHNDLRGHLRLVGQRNWQEIRMEMTRECLLTTPVW